MHIWTARRVDGYSEVITIHTGQFIYKAGWDLRMHSHGLIYMDLFLIFM